MFIGIVEHVSVRGGPDDLGLVDTEHCLLIKNDSEGEQTQAKSIYLCSITFQRHSSYSLILLKHFYSSLNENVSRSCTTTRKRLLIRRMPYFNLRRKPEWKWSHLRIRMSV